MGEKKRLDLLVCEKGLADSRQRAQQYIMAGEIFVGGQRVDKPGTAVDISLPLEHRGDTCPFVSRGGYKLDKALRVFPIDLKNAVCMDIGASTGGFTDCMLQNGAKKVYCIDVGYGQLAWKLREDPRVVNFERTNIRYLEPEKIADPVDFISIDVSFISLELVLPVAMRFLRPGGSLVALIKPQFEAGKDLVGKNGVVRDAKVHGLVIQKVLDFCREKGWTVSGLAFSPIKGPKGNVEFLLYVSDCPGDVDVFSVVDAAHQNLDGDER